MSIHVGTILDEKITWCGVLITEGMLVLKDAEIAAIAGKIPSENETVVCEFCINAIVSSLYKNRS